MTNWPEKIDIAKEYNHPTAKKLQHSHDNGFNQARTLCAQVLKERVDIQKMMEVTTDLVDKHFPKHECQERGQALVLHAEMLIAISKMMMEGVGEPL